MGEGRLIKSVQVVLQAVQWCMKLVTSHLGMAYLVLLTVHCAADGAPPSQAYLKGVPRISVAMCLL